MIRFRLFGISVGASVGFFAILSLMLYVDQTGLFLQTIEATAVHEVGHLCVMWILGCPPRAIECRVGAVILRGRLEASPKSEALISLAGPLANLIGFQMAFLCYYFFGWEAGLSRALVHLVMGVFHLLPIEGLDGGTVLFCLLSGRQSVDAVRQICRAVSLVLLFGLSAVGVWALFRNQKNPSLLFLAIYLTFFVLLGKKKNNRCNLGQNAVK